jgi:hypothetical protein
MRRDGTSEAGSTNVCSGSFGGDLTARRTLRLELPEFLVYALEVRVAEANEGAAPEEQCTYGRIDEAFLVLLPSQTPRYGGTAGNTRVP